MPWEGGGGGGVTGLWSPWKGFRQYRGRGRSASAALVKRRDRLDGTPGGSPEDMNITHEQELYPMMMS